MINKNLKKILAGGTIAGALLVGGLSGAPGEPTYIIVPVGDFKAEYWESTYEEPRTVQYSDDAEYLIVSFDGENIPRGLKNKATYSETQITAIKTNVHGAFHNSTIAAEATEQRLAEDDNYESE